MWNPPHRDMRILTLTSRNEGRRWQVRLPYSGKHIWLWELDATLHGDVGAILAGAKAMGCLGILVKYNDGGPGPITAELQSNFRRLVAPMKVANLVVGAWGYIYGQEPKAEAELALQALDEGADWYVFDAETPLEGRPQAAELLGEYIRSAAPRAPIGYSSFALPSLHGRFPYRVFDAFCQVFLPQVYWGAMGVTPEGLLTRCLEEAAHMGLKAPVAPVGQAFPPVTASDVAAFVDTARAHGLPGISFFDYQSATTEIKAAIAREAYAPAAVAHGPLHPPSLPILAARLENLATELRAIADDLRQY